MLDTDKWQLSNVTINTDSFTEIRDGQFGRFYMKRLAHGSDGSDASDWVHDCYEVSIVV
jgi:hypothetical protein